MDALKILKEHESEIKRRLGVKRIGIFGSHDRGEEKETSDVDVLVEFVVPSFDNFMDLAFFLEELFGREVDHRHHRGSEPPRCPLCGTRGGLGLIRVLAQVAPAARGCGVAAGEGGGWGAKNGLKWVMNLDLSSDPSK